MKSIFRGSLVILSLVFLFAAHGREQEKQRQKDETTPKEGFHFPASADRKDESVFQVARKTTVLLVMLRHTAALNCARATQNRQNRHRLWETLTAWPLLANLRDRKS